MVTRKTDTVILFYGLHPEKNNLLLLFGIILLEGNIYFYKLSDNYYFHWFAIISGFKSWAIMQLCYTETKSDLGIKIGC